MRSVLRRALLATTVMCLLSLSVVPAMAQEEGDNLGWSDEAELGIVSTSGNAESTSFGFKNTTWRRWEKALLEIKLGGIRVRTTTKDDFFTQQAGGQLTRGETTDTTAENYYLNGRYNREIRENFFWYAGAGWDRNEPAGIEDRYLVEGGVGNIWKDTEKMRWRTDYGLTYTDQSDVVPDPTIEESFLGARATSKFWIQITDTTEYSNDTIFDFNFDETDDWRVNMINAIAVSISKSMSLKLSHQLLYDNLPAAIEVRDTGGALVPGVFGEADELDSILTMSLVVNFK